MGTPCAGNPESPRSPDGPPARRRVCLRSPVSFPLPVGAAEGGLQLLFESRRRSVPTARQGPHHDSVRRVEIRQNRTGRVTQPAGHAMPNDCVSHGFGHDQSDVRCRAGLRTGRVHHKIGLRGAHAALDGVGELCRPCHPVTSRQHWYADRSVRQSANDGPCGAGRSRWRGRHESASVTGNRELVPGAGYSAGRCACPWPRSSLLVTSPAISCCGTDSAAAALVAKFNPNRRGPEEAGRCRATRGWETLPRVLRSLGQVKPH